MARRKQDYFDNEINILSMWVQDLRDQISSFGQQKSAERQVLEFYKKQFETRLNKLQFVIANAA